jgi:molybdopterin molybdotransferase
VTISTGAPVPAGADAVVPIERTEQGDAGAVRLPDTTPGANIRRAGEDLRAGDTVLRAGTQLGPAELGVLASLGLAEPPCARRPRVALLVTGDELAEPGTPLGAGQIYGSNDHALAAQAALAGGEVVLRERVPDDPGHTRAALDRALSADVVVISGGVSVGPHDHVKGALSELGAEQAFWGLRLKPGKPCWFGTREQALVFGLPGNPVSAMVTFQLLARPALRALLGADPAAPRAEAILGVAVPLNREREQAIRCRLLPDDGGWRAQPTGEQGSHRLTSMLGADALALIPPGEGELAAGERVEIEMLRQ